MERAAKILVLVSAAAAASLELTLASTNGPALVPWSGLALAAGLIAGRLCPGWAASAGLAAGYVFPILAGSIVGRFYFATTIVWHAALLGVLLAGGRRALGGWDVPSAFKVPLALWALVIALGWPIVVLRESDFTIALLNNYRLATTGEGIAPPTVSLWIAHVALAQLMAILWLDWLFGAYAADRFERALRQLLLPPLLAVLGGCALSVYQGYVDLGFLSGGPWPTLRRAAGPLFDANASGTLAAMWAPVLASVTLGRRGFIATVLRTLVFLLAVVAVWVSGSRTALLACAVGTALVAVSLLRHARSVMTRRQLAMSGAGAVLLLAAVGLLVVAVPRKSISPVRRAVSAVRANAPDSSLQYVRALWDREGYGAAAVRMIRDHPMLGIGIGSYHSLGLDYTKALRGTPLPPDNAQNWFRHQLAELGVLGSLGWIWLLAIVARRLVGSTTLTERIVLPNQRRERSERAAAGRGGGAPRQIEQRELSWAVRGALIGFGLVSLVGQPGQNTAIALTLSLFLFMCIRPDDFDTARRVTRASGRPERRHGAWLLVWVLAIVWAAGSWYLARHDLRVPFRAARFDFDYAYGFHPRETPDLLWTERHAVAVLPARTSWLKLTFWITHPDAANRPVEVRIWRDHERVVRTTLHTATPIVKVVPVPGGNRRFVLETDVDRTWRPADYGQHDARQLGLAIRWEFLRLKTED